MDQERVVELVRLDPEGRRSGYWSALHAQILRSAGPELQRRRARALTVYDVVFSWARAVVPAAAAAAALSLGFLANGDVVVPMEPVAVDDVLQGGTTPETFAMFFASDLLVEEGAFFAALEGRRPEPDDAP